MAISVKIERESITDNDINRVRRDVGDDEDRELGDETIRDLLEDCAYQESCDGPALFDWNMAASDALLRLATKYRKQVRMSASGQSMDLQDKAIAAERQAGIFAAKALPRIIEMNREDTWF